MAGFRYGILYRCAFRDPNPETDVEWYGLSCKHMINRSVARVTTATVTIEMIVKTDLESGLDTFLKEWSMCIMLVDGTDTFV